MFSSVVESDNYKKYNIKGQYKLIKCKKYDIKYDLIFIDTNEEGLLDGTSNDLSKVFYKYTCKNTNKEMYLGDLLDKSRRILSEVIKTNIVNIYNTGSSKEHFIKMQNRCKELGFIYQTPDIIEDF